MKKRWKRFFLAVLISALLCPSLPVVHAEQPDALSKAEDIIEDPQDAFDMKTKNDVSDCADVETEMEDAKEPLSNAEQPENNHVHK